jgi:peptidyl-prolyl cis-trans isomerase D
MFMRSIRANTKWIMMVMAVAFAAWLVFEGLQQRDQANVLGVNPIVATVNGEQVRNVRWNEALSVALDAARARTGRPLTDEEVRQVEREAWDAMIRDILVEQEIQRLGIEVTESEIRQAFRTSPPPDLVRHPVFQTDGRFDFAKYQQFFSDPTVDEQLLLQIESYYRSTLPRTRLAQQISGGSAVSDGEVWQAYRDQNETATVTFLSARPEQVVPASELQVTEADARAWYRQNRDEFARPATATVRLASFSTTPSAVDTGSARARADSAVRAIREGSAEFAAVAAELSADSLSAGRGGELGRFGPGDLVEPVAEAVAGLGVGETSEPVLTPQGFRILRVSDRVADTVQLAHILVPVTLSEQGEEEMFRRMDEFEGIALLRGMRAAGEETGVPVRDDVTVSEGFDFVPGAGSLGVAVDWALNPETPLDEASEYFENGAGFHMVEVTSRTEAGSFAFEEVRPQIEQTLAARKRVERAREIVGSRMDEIRAAGTLEAAAETLGWPIDRAGPFTRGQFVAGLGRGTEAVGAAFGAMPGAIVGPYDADGALVVMRVDGRTGADPNTFTVLKNQLRAQMEFQGAQLAVNRWVEALREKAVIVDQRGLLQRSARAG